MNTLILGIGSTWRKDDGIGPAVIAALQKEKFSGCDLLDGRTDALSLIDVIKLYKKTIIIDAVNMNESPGTIRVFKPSEAKINIKNSVSTHGFGLSELINILDRLEIKTSIEIVGIQPKNISFGQGMSTTVKNKIPIVIDYIKNML